MRVGNPVVGDPDPIVPNRKHLDVVRVGIVDRLDRIGVACQGYRKSLLHETCRLLSLLGRNQVEGPDLVVLAPASPIGKVRLPTIVLCAGDHMR